MLTLNIYITVGFRVCPFWDERDSLYFDLFFQALTKLKKIYLHLFHLFCIMFSFFEILQTAGLCIFNKSQNHRMFGVGRDLCGSSSPTPLPKQGHLQQAKCETQVRMKSPDILSTRTAADFWILLYKTWHHSTWNFYSNFIEKITTLATIFLLWILRNILWEFREKSVFQNIMAPIFVFV